MIINLRLKTGAKTLEKIVNSEIAQYMIGSPATVRTTKFVKSVISDGDQAIHDKWTALKLSMPIQKDECGRRRSPTHSMKMLDHLIIRSIEYGDELSEK